MRQPGAAGPRAERRRRQAILDGSPIDFWLYVVLLLCGPLIRLTVIQLLYWLTGDPLIR